MKTLLKIHGYIGIYSDYQFNQLVYLHYWGMMYNIIDFYDDVLYINDIYFKRKIAFHFEIPLL